MQTEQILNCVSEATAYVITRFPFNFGILCHARYWVDTNRTYGQRIITQYSKDPNGSEWYAPKPTGYFDIAILTKRSDPNDPYCGHVIPVTIEMDSLQFAHLIQFSEYYVFTPYQKKKILGEFNVRKIGDREPNWKDDSLLNEMLINAAEGIDKRPGKPKGKPSFVDRKAQWILDGMSGPMPVKQPDED